MSENFKILIAYDSSDFADAALEDMRLAGLPEEGVEALIVSVAEVWLPAKSGLEEEGEYYLPEKLKKKQERNLQILAETGQKAEKAAKRVSSMFPGWQVASKATYGSAASEILYISEDFRPDLVVVGSQGLSALKRIWLGSISQKIVRDASCSVRVARRSEFTKEGESRVLIAFDGTDGAEKAVEAVFFRNWPEDTRIRVVVAEDFEMMREAFSSESAISKLEERGEEIVVRFQEKGLRASLKIVEGDPKEVLVREAMRFRANCIFVGATKFSSRLERFFLGSVSSAITARAECSVEVVRPNYYHPED